MSLLALMELQSQASKLKLIDDPSQYMGLLKGIGVVDESTVQAVVKAARLVSRDPNETIADFVKGGGLGRLLAGQKPSEEEEDVVVSCPHCDGTIFLKVNAP